MSTSVKKFAPSHHEKAMADGLVMFKWEMDKRYVADKNDRALIQCIGTMSVERQRRIWAIINEKEQA